MPTDFEAVLVMYRFNHVWLRLSSLAFGLVTGAALGHLAGKAFTSANQGAVQRARVASRFGISTERPYAIDGRPARAVRLTDGAIVRIENHSDVIAVTWSTTSGPGDFLRMAEARLGIRSDSLGLVIDKGRHLHKNLKVSEALAMADGGDVILARLDDQIQDLAIAWEQSPDASSVFPVEAGLASPKVDRATLNFLLVNSSTAAVADSSSEILDIVEALAVNQPSMHVESVRSL